MNLTLKVIQDMLECEILNFNENNSVTGVSIDSRNIEPGDLYVPLRGEHTDGHKFILQAIENGASVTLWDQMIELPDIDIPVILCDNVEITLQRLAFVYRKMLNGKIIAVTGSNGKTSVKDLLAAFLSGDGKTQKTAGNLNNQLGVPLTILRFDEDIKYGIVEMGMENLGEIAFLSTLVEPDYTMITNVGNAHLENLGSMENIAKAKWEIVQGMKKEGIIIVNGDDHYLTGERHNHKKHKVLSFGKSDIHNFYYYDFQSTMNYILFSSNIYPTIEISVLGEHQAMNAIACLGLCSILNIPYDKIIKGLENLQLTGLRNSLVTIKNMTILNDSYKSNPESARAALSLFASLPGKYKIAILGDMLDLGPKTHDLHFNLGAELIDFQVDHLITYGELGSWIAKGAKGKVEKITEFLDKQELIEFVKQYINQDTLVLIKGSRGMRLEEVVEAMKEEGTVHE